MNTTQDEEKWNKNQKSFDNSAHQREFSETHFSIFSKFNFYTKFNI